MESDAVRNGVVNQKPETRNPKPETRKQKAESRKQKAERLLWEYRRPREWRVTACAMVLSCSVAEPAFLLAVRDAVIIPVSYENGCNLKLLGNEVYCTA